VLFPKRVRGGVFRSVNAVRHSSKELVSKLFNAKEIYYFIVEIKVEVENGLNRLENPART